MKHALPLSFACATLIACASTSSSQQAGYGDAHQEPVAEPFRLALIDAQGEPFDVSDMQGKQRLLYLFATFDLPSQAALEPLREVAQQHPELAVIGIALQPNPRDLLQIFASTLSVEFPLAYEPDNRLLQGLTELGRIGGVPTYVLIDHEGFVQKQITGAMNAPTLAQWCGFD